MADVGRYLALLALTLAIELPIAAVLAGRGRRGDVLRACLALNLLTHPLACGLAWLAGAAWLPLELAVLAVEVAGYRALTRLSWTRALLVAAGANLATALVGALWAIA